MKNHSIDFSSLLCREIEFSFIAFEVQDIKLFSIRSSFLFRIFEKKNIYINFVCRRFGKIGKTQFKAFAAYFLSSTAKRESCYANCELSSLSELKTLRVGHDENC